MRFFVLRALRDRFCIKVQVLLEGAKEPQLGKRGNEGLLLVVTATSAGGSTAVVRLLERAVRPLELVQGAGHAVERLGDEPLRVHDAIAGVAAVEQVRR